MIEFMRLFVLWAYSFLVAPTSGSASKIYLHSSRNSLGMKCDRSETSRASKPPSLTKNSQPFSKRWLLNYATSAARRLLLQV